MILHVVHLCCIINLSDKHEQTWKKLDAILNNTHINTAVLFISFVTLWNTLPSYVNINTRKTFLCAPDSDSKQILQRFRFHNSSIVSNLFSNISKSTIYYLNLLLLSYFFDSNNFLVHATSRSYQETSIFFELINSNSRFSNFLHGNSCKTELLKLLLRTTDNDSIACKSE